MLKLFAQLGRQIQDFVEQRDDLLMMAPCTENDSPLALNTMRDIEQATGSDVFLLFGNNFEDASSFVSSAVAQFEEEHRLACEALTEEGEEPFPSLPATLFDEDRPPVDRLHEAIDAARALVPADGGHRLVWAMFPGKIADRQAYLELVESFVPHNGPQPWMRGLRLVFRDEADFESFAPQIATAPRVRVARIDLGPEAMQQSLNDEAEDEQLPDNRRMQALLQLACLDAAHNRKEDAIEKYTSLLGYYQQTEDLAMQAFVMNGLGDVYRRNEQFDQARHWYECAVTPAVASESPVIMATVTRNLGELAYEFGAFADAEQYFDGLDKLTSHLLDPEGKAKALEWRGLSQEKQKAYDRAIESWESAVQLCSSIGLTDAHRTNLEHLQRGYAKVGDAEGRRKAKDQASGLSKEENA